MKADPNSHTGRIGVAGTQLLFKRLGWIFREQPIEDYGIDAHVEVVEDDIATGRLIALQIKSGKSWFGERTTNGFVFRGKVEHLEYWQMHSLPVIIVLYDDEEEAAYWQIVNSSNVQRTDKAWKLILPFDQQINAQSLKKIKDFSKKLVTPTSYTILSLQDNSHSRAKVYFANILLSKEYTKFEIIEIVRKITAELERREYYRNKQTKSYWKNKRAQVIRLFLYLSLDDVSSANWICRTQWISKRLSRQSSPMRLKGEIIDNETVIDWNQHYTEYANIFATYRLSKEDYLDSISEILEQTKLAVSKVVELTNLFNNSYLDETEYLGDMSQLEQIIKELYFQATDLGSAPTECSNFGESFQSLMAFAHNTVLPFSERGLKTWKAHKRNYLVTQAINDYQKELLRLEFEFEKIR